jgi:hypothetical protein
MSASNDEVIRLSMETKESLEREMAELHWDVERLGERFDAAGARLDRQALIRAGRKPAMKRQILPLFFTINT